MPQFYMKLSNLALFLYFMATLPLSSSSYLVRVRLNSTFEFERSAVVPEPKSHPIFCCKISKASNFISKEMTERKPLKKSSKRQRLEDEEKGGGEALGDIEDLFSVGETQRIRDSMLDWYDKNQRDLPWRRRTRKIERDEENGCDGENVEDDGGRRAYQVWVSEVMLQQTRVQTVIEYFNRWMRKWPTIDDLAQASLEEVNEMWAGLGYYRRARFLLEGAKMIVEGKQGFPDKALTLRKVKGIGDYTSGAIASIAFNEVVPVVDGNVVRVLARLKAISANPKDRTTVKKFWELAAQLVDPSRPGDFNQSLMELGATLCTPLNPSCSTCPVSDQCCAFSLSRQQESVLVTDYPSKTIKAEQKHDFSCVCVVEIMETQNHSANRFLLVKRPDKGLLAGLWEFPTVTLNEEANLATRRKEIDRLLKKKFRLDPKKSCSVVSREDVGEFVHIFTHIRRKIYVEFIVLRLKGEMNDFFSKQPQETTSWKCVDGDALSNMGLTTAVRKVYSMVQEFKKNLSSGSSKSRKTTKPRKRSLS